MASSWIGRLFKGAQGKVNEAGEAAADAVLIPELEQRIRDAERKKEDVRDSAAKMQANLKLTQDKAAKLEAEITEEKDKARQLIAAKGQDHELVPQLLQRIRSLQGELETANQLKATQEKAAQDLKDAYTRVTSDIEAHKQRIVMLKSQQEVIEARKATSSASSAFGSSLGSASESMERLEKKQAEDLAVLEAREGLSNTDKSLDDELASMGIGTNATSNDDLLKELSS